MFFFYIFAQRSLGKLMHQFELFSLGIRIIDHGDGLIALRVMKAMVSGCHLFTCMVASEYGCCSTSCEVSIQPSVDVAAEMIPKFIEEPVPVVAMHGSVVSFCARVDPIVSKIKWFICGREITENTRGTIVSNLRHTFSM